MLLNKNKFSDGFPVPTYLSRSMEISNERNQLTVEKAHS